MLFRSESIRARPARLIDKDLSSLKKIYWIDDNPESVRGVMAALGLRHLQPSRFVAFMPETLEKHLFDLEKREMERKVRTYDEDRIAETIFRVVPGPGGRYDAQLVSLTLK